MSTDQAPASRLRVVAYCILPQAYHLLTAWARANGHKLVLVITTPGPAARRSSVYREIVAVAPPMASCASKPQRSL